ncbi:hypothetical protein HHK36_015187 [Tetracentron sinense]|uniref:Uncharacterized protein n=1 Tax=Tetracentron sinense TaxID=13715 RepID=A0A834ZAH7_TETSI|nr:hypothetical protein HHK36_015187 [Tetracentron sinense]
MTVSSSPIWAFPASSATLSLNLLTLAALKIEPWVPSVRLFSSPTVSMVRLLSGFMFVFGSIDIVLMDLARFTSPSQEAQGTAIEGRCVSGLWVGLIGVGGSRIGALLAKVVEPVTGGPTPSTISKI